MDLYPAIQSFIDELKQTLQNTPDDLSSLDNIGGFELDEINTDNEDGKTIHRTAILNPNIHPAIELGNWKLKLIPQNDEDGSLRIPISITLAGNDIEEIDIQLARFELEADPNHLIAADLHTSPHTHLTAVEDPAPVKLLGPALHFKLLGNDLSRYALETMGAANGNDDDFPSARFEPPHFLVGSKDSDIGVVCDEVLLDLSTDDNPNIVDDRLPDTSHEWRGLYLKEIGVFIGDGTEVGTWSGMASMKDFFIGFDNLDLSGSFIGELVHYALENDPQVQITISYENDNGGITKAADEGDALIPAPINNQQYRRVLIQAKPNWDSAGFRTVWTIPNGVAAEEPWRATQLNLGWVLIPANNRGFEFGLNVTDHRVPNQQLARRIVVAEPVQQEQDLPPRVLLEGRLANTQGPAASNRLHMELHPGDSFSLQTEISRGSGGNINITLTLPDGFSTADALVVNGVSQLNNSLLYPTQTWQVSVNNNLAAMDGTAVLTVNDTGNNTVNHHRLRLKVSPPLAASHPDFRLVTYADWRDKPGIGLAHIQLLNGLQFKNINWTLESLGISTDFFTDAAKDAYFVNGQMQGFRQEPVKLTNSAGTVRPFLHEANRIWRLTGTVSNNNSTPRRPVVVGTSSGQLLGITEIQQQCAPHNQLDNYQTSGEQNNRTILFSYDCDQIQPSAGCTNSGPEANPLSRNAVNREQAKGFVTLYQAIEHYGDQIDSILLVGSASSEGAIAYNEALSERRVNAVKTALPNPSQTLRTAMSQLNYNVNANTLARLNNLQIDALHIGERHVRAPKHPEDRQVFAIFKLKNATSNVHVSHQEYFLTAPGAIPPAITPPTPMPRLQDHPFRHSMFRLVHVEVELLHNELVRLQLRLKLDLEAFNENDLMPGGNLNELDGVTTFFLQMHRNPAPEANEPTYSWELVALADPKDVDGFAVLKKPENNGVLNASGGLITVPAITALSGGRVGTTGFLMAVGIGTFLSQVPFQQDGAQKTILDIQTFIWRGIRFKLRHGNVENPSLSFALDYDLKYHINANLEELIGIPINLTTKKPIAIGFRNVGIEVTNMQNVEFFYNPADGFRLDIDDPGVFTLGDGIGRLLNVNQFRMGAGSPLWFEVELALALETGIVKLDSLRIRITIEMDQLFEANDEGVVTLDENSLSLGDIQVVVNKIGASVNVPNVLEGKGDIAFGNDSNGAFNLEGNLDLALKPLDMQIYGGMKIYSKDDLHALYAYIGMKFAPGIPIFNTGAAIYGFEGLIGINMDRSIEHPLEWMTRNPKGVTHTSKWKPARGNWAFGVGTVIGTVFDNGFTFNTKGSLLLQIPGPKIALATESNLIRIKPAVDSAEQGTLLSVIMLDLQNQLFLIGLDFEFKQDNLYRLHIPAEMYFNLRDANDWYLRFGQWLPKSKRIEITVFELFKAWGYIQIEGNGLTIPDKLSLSGTCFAMGGRLEVFWGSRSAGIYLDAYTEFHAGLQLKPLYVQGVLQAGGKLHLAVASLSVSGRLDAKAPDPYVIKGKICGKLDLWLFTIRGCAEFTLGDGNAALPPPESPIEKLSVLDRMTSTEIDDTQNVPLDTVLQLSFNQDMIDQRPDTAISFNSGNLRNQVSDDLFYEFQVKSVRLSQKNGNDVVIEHSAWQHYSLKDATAEEANNTRTLALLSWLPQAHDRLLDFSTGYGETLKALAKQLCESDEPPALQCSTFDDEEQGIKALWVLDTPKLKTVYVLNPKSDTLGLELINNATLSSSLRVVDRPAVDYASRVAEKQSLRLAGKENTAPRFSLKHLFPNTAFDHDPQPTETEDAPASFRIDPALADTFARRLDNIERLTTLNVESPSTSTEGTIGGLFAHAELLDHVHSNPLPVQPDSPISFDNPIVIAEPPVNNFGSRRTTIGTTNIGTSNIGTTTGRFSTGLSSGRLNTGVNTGRLSSSLSTGRLSSTTLSSSFGGFTAVRPPAFNFPSASSSSSTSSGSITASATFSQPLRLSTIDIEPVSELPRHGLTTHLSDNLRRAVELNNANASVSVNTDFTIDTSDSNTATDNSNKPSKDTPSNAASQAAIWLSGMFIIRLPDLVKAELTFINPEKLALDGECLFLDKQFKPVSPIYSFLRADSSERPLHHSPEFRRHIVTKIRFDGINANGPNEHLIASWVFVNPPAKISLTAGADPYSYLNDICGIRYSEWQRWEQQQQHRRSVRFELEQLTSIQGALAPHSQFQLLEPDTEYELETELAWKRFENQNDSDEKDSGTFTTHKASFKTSSTPPSSIQRYILNHDPLDDRQPHYYKEAVNIQFNSDIVDRLFAKYGKQLVARAKAATGGHALYQPITDDMQREFFPIGSFEETLYEALQNAGPCLQNDNWERLFPKPKYQFAEPLTPNAGYTISLLPRPEDEPNQDFETWTNVLEEAFNAGESVFRFDLKTSRYGDFAEHVKAYKDTTVGDLFADDQNRFDAAIRSFSNHERSDQAMDTLLQSLFGGPLAIPKQPEVMRIWVPTNNPADEFSLPTYRCRAILLDGTEPLLKYNPDLSIRTTLEARRTVRPNAIPERGNPLRQQKLVVSERGSRVVVLFNEANPPQFVHIGLQDTKHNEKQWLPAIAIGDQP